MKRKYVKPTIALCLVAALAIAGTLAYLTDTTGELVNEFTIDKDISIDLDETYEDFELYPDTIQDKDPTVTVLANSSYVFIEVTEKLPTAALGTSSTGYSFSDYVEYSINGLYDTTTTNNTTSTAGGTVYLYDEANQVVSASGTDWYWMLIEGPTSGTGTYDNTEDGGTDEYTITTYVYALVNSTGDLIAVSSLDGTVASTAPTEGTEADYPILDNDEVYIPADLSQEMLDLFIITDSDPEDTYSADLSFIGYAVQSAGLESESVENVYYAAVNNSLPTE